MALYDISEVLGTLEWAIVPKCKKIFYIAVDDSPVSAYNKGEVIEGGHRNEV